MEAFDNTPLKDSFELEGSAGIFLTRCVSKLIDYGFLATGEHAIARLLSKARKQTGDDKHAEIDDLINLANAFEEPARRRAETPVKAPREIELAYLEQLKREKLLHTERYTPMSGDSRQKLRVEMHPVFELFPVAFGKDNLHRLKPRRIDNVVEEIRRIRRAVLLGEPGGGSGSPSASPAIVLESAGITLSADHSTAMSDGFGSLANCLAAKYSCNN